MTNDFYYQTDPKHYTRLNPEPALTIIAWGLNYPLGCAVKYIVRAGYKEGNSEEQDVRKAIRYLELYLTSLANEEIDNSDKGSNNGDQ